ncbi:MAG: DUF3467 domain-containing protein [Methanimicrococcus sp.]|nr:DUF3467 domain-containing protein [Methanimicrococcus sp.]
MNHVLGMTKMSGNNQADQKNNAPAQGGQPIEIVLEISKEDDFKRFYAIGAIGVNNIYDFRISFYNDEPDLGRANGVRKVQRKIGTEVILSPVAAAELSRWLDQNVKDYEKKFGPIKTQGHRPPEGNKNMTGSDGNVLDGYA